MQNYEDPFKEVIEQVNYAKKNNLAIYKSHALMLEKEDYKEIARVTKCRVDFKIVICGYSAHYEVRFYEEDNIEWTMNYESDDVIDEKENFIYDGTTEQEVEDD